MHQHIEIIYLHRKLTHCPAKEDRQAFLQALPKHDRDALVHFWRRVMAKGQHDEQAIHATYILKEILVEFSAREHYLSDITVAEINALADFMRATRRYEDAVNIVDILHLERGVRVFSEAERLFRTLVQDFEHLESEEVREMVTENLVEFMRENKKYIAIANEPYYFMEYFLHVVNQEQDADRSLYWFETLLSLYMHPRAEQHLFYENDFRILVDILVRHIENYRDEQELAKYLETYLVLSISPFIVRDHQYYKLQHILIVLNDVPHPNPAVLGYGQELRSLLQEKL